MNSLANANWVKAFSLSIDHWLGIASLAVIAFAILAMLVFRGASAKNNFIKLLLFVLGLAGYIYVYMQ